jgi:hypothetical protein
MYRNIQGLRGWIYNNLLIFNYTAQYDAQVRYFTINTSKSSYLLGYNAVSSVEKSEKRKACHLLSRWYLSAFRPWRRRRCSSETSADFSTGYTALYLRRQLSTLHNHRRENSKPYTEINESLNSLGEVSSLEEFREECLLVTKPRTPTSH